MTDIVIDATENKGSLEQSLEYISFGGKVVYVGLVKDTIHFHNPDFHKRETILMGSRNATMEDFQMVYNLLRKRKFDMQKFITNRSLFANMIKDFTGWTNPNSAIIKAMVEV